jgi:MerR family transcriptional regulator, mercuric resistance operon regulatory protein
MHKSQNGSAPGFSCDGKSGNGTPAQRSYRASECARLAGVSTDTLRYYERQRLLPAPPRGGNGYRRYPLEALTRVRVIRAALAVGFSVEELKQILGARDHGATPCQLVRQLAASKLEALEARIRELRHLRAVMRKTLEAWDQRLAHTPAGARAALLENLAKVRPAASRQLSPLLAPALQRKLTPSGGSCCEAENAKNKK